MPDKTPCLYCERVGFVRTEHTLKAAIATTDYYCGSCDRSWSVPRTPPEAPERAKPAKS
jgi:hypothetical protein